MKETLTVQKEFEIPSKMSVTVIGPSCSGKTTLLRYFAQLGHTVHPEPENSIFPMFLKDPHKYAFHNQMNLSARLMELEIQGLHDGNISDPHFRESGVLATQIYNRYLRDAGYLTPEQFEHLDWLYKDHMRMFPKPDLVVFLTANSDALKDRAVVRDGAVALEPESLQKYWDELLGELDAQQIPVITVNTFNRPITETAAIISHTLTELKQQKNKQHGS